MDLLRPPRTSSEGVEPQFRQVGFVTKSEPAASSPSASELSPGSLSRIMIPPPRIPDHLSPLHASEADSLLPSSPTAFILLAIITLVKPLRRLTNRLCELGTLDFPSVRSLIGVVIQGYTAKMSTANCYQHVKSTKPILGKTRKLKDLMIKSDNRICADCGTPDPKWVSTNIGVFLYLKCGDVHRALRPDISKVLSVTLDDWSNSDIDSMVEVSGNSYTNSIYEAFLSSKKITQT